MYYASPKIFQLPPDGLKVQHFLAGKVSYLTLSTKIAISSASRGKNTIFKLTAALSTVHK